jgi:hypothetical protein
VPSNHHVGSRAVQRLSTREHSYLRDGFYARTGTEERPCAGLELRVLINIEDFNTRANAAVAPGLSDEPEAGNPIQLRLHRGHHRR